MRWLRESSELPAAEQSLRAIQQASSGVLRDLEALTQALASGGLGLGAPAAEVATTEDTSTEGVQDGGERGGRDSSRVLGLQKAVRLARVSSPGGGSGSGDETDALSQSEGAAEEGVEEGRGGDEDQEEQQQQSPGGPVGQGGGGGG